ncbi:MAG TPA: molecular chaperone Tir [Cyanobacteria bacterium UBA11149]|nr:molecular chaperone Tir [Cyanobacteria bacterium UBA11367]HBE61102.1 molecular chaperone Tir [Cyanobacteria bacterium UBA11366]HBK64388.1 molecular chaperone Tir [Cyanobacteria bacterium UBA11166]HBR72722.1 molecular chaperone Tir [Cyanobacteria bacterium UBA11159]HBS70708.1 molecular chaperone Tir [Cyanobacteria bacterium UBA11153]HBW90657.1 molecular chaperone Tir [Cyanobacteria bacterium UBA11149]
MDFQEALEFVDKLTYAKTGKHLNDLEREVFIGSWQGRTYEEIYPHNPEYIEKYVGYKLWQKLSIVLGEKVTKKKIQGAIARNWQRQERVFISHRHQEPDLSLAIELEIAIAKRARSAIAKSGYQALMAPVQTGEGTPSLLEKEWLSRIDQQLTNCDYFILLLSPQAAVSEMVIEELRRAKELQDSHHNAKPVLLPIRVNCPPNTPLNHDLRNYLDGIAYCEWKSPLDTPKIVKDVLKQLSGNGKWGTRNGEVENEAISTSYIEETTESSASLPTSVALPTPLPVAEPELPQGQVRLDSLFYVERIPYEAQCYKEIMKPGMLIRIKAPRQMGKTSLMARILDRAREHGCRTVALSFQDADRTVFTNLDKLLQWFCARITRKLRLPYQIDKYWHDDTFGSKDNCTDYFEDCLLSAGDEPLVLGLDEVDRVFQYPQIADDFFGLLRAWYEKAGYGDSDSDLWEKLRLVVVHSTEVYIPMDINQSPFNVGLPIELLDFSFEQVSNLAGRHGLNCSSSEVARLMGIIGGHPYLVRLALYQIAREELTLNRLIEIAPTEAGIYGDHLRRHLWNLQQYPELGTAFAKVLTNTEPMELESVLAFKLHSMGLVQLQGNYVTPRFELYRQYFRDRLSLVVGN